MLELLEQLYLHRISHLNKYAARQNLSLQQQDLNIPTKQELSAYLSGQLSLFPKGSGSFNGPETKSLSLNSLYPFMKAILTKAWINRESQRKNSSGYLCGFSISRSGILIRHSRLPKIERLKTSLT